MNLALEIAFSVFCIVVGVVLLVRYGDVGAAFDLTEARMKRAKVLGCAAILVGIAWLLLVIWPS